jgi:hypothetical protein
MSKEKREYIEKNEKLATPVPSAGATPVPSAGATGQAGQADPHGLTRTF